MLIKMTCPQCEAELLIDDIYAGKSGRCKKCQARITVPDIANEAEDELDTVEPVESMVSTDIDPEVRKELDLRLIAGEVTQEEYNEVLETLGVGRSTVSTGSPSPSQPPPLPSPSGDSIVASLSSKFSMQPKHIIIIAGSIAAALMLFLVGTVAILASSAGNNGAFGYDSERQSGRSSSADREEEAKRRAERKAEEARRRVAQKREQLIRIGQERMAADGRNIMGTAHVLAGYRGTEYKAYRDTVKGHELQFSMEYADNIYNEICHLQVFMYLDDEGNCTDFTYGSDSGRFPPGFGAVVLEGIINDLNR